MVSVRLEEKKRLAFSTGFTAYNAVKRSYDIVFGILGIIISLPISIIVSLAIFIENPGPVIFVQKRLGQNGRMFRIMKYRSMRVDAEKILKSDPALWRKYVEQNYKLPEDQDPRVTRVGRIIRKLSLDEIPQLWNVVAGHMSLVGPRPLVQEEIDQWYEGREAVLLSVKPGLTGLWQATGRSTINYPERADLELHYIRHRSVLLDLKIILMTFKAVITSRGAY